VPFLQRVFKNVIIKVRHKVRRVPPATAREKETGRCTNPCCLYQMLQLSCQSFISNISAQRPHSMCIAYRTKVTVSVIAFLCGYPLQSWPAWLQSQTLAITVITARTAVRLSTRQTTPVIICFFFCSQNQQSLHILHHVLFLQLSPRCGILLNRTSVCSLTRLLQIPPIDRTAVCRL